MEGVRDINIFMTHQISARVTGKELTEVSTRLIYWRIVVLICWWWSTWSYQQIDWGCWQDSCACACFIKYFWYWFKRFYFTLVLRPFCMGYKGTEPHNSSINHCIIGKFTYSFVCLLTFATITWIFHQKTNSH